MEEEDTDAEELLDPVIGEDWRLLLRDFVLGLAPKDLWVTKESGGGNMFTGAPNAPPPAEEDESIDELFDVNEDTVLENGEDPDKVDLGGLGGGGIASESSSLLSRRGVVSLVSSFLLVVGGVLLL